MDKKYDVIIIGAGPAGYSCAVRFAQLGNKVALIEKNEIGGTCLNTGCIPTKFLWQSLKIKNSISKAYEYGIKTAPAEINFQDIISKKNKLVENLRKSLQRMIESYKIEIIKGTASFISCSIIKVNDVQLTAEKIIVAAGSTPKSIPGVIIDHNKFIDSTDALSLNEVPKKMLVIGGGAIGIELATIYCGFGSEITLREILPQLLPGEDSEIAKEIEKNLLRQGVSVETGCADALKDADSFDKVLIVAGRQSTSQELSVKNAGLQTDLKNYIISENGTTNNKNIFAAGDATGKNFLAYTAQQDGINIAENNFNKTEFVIPKAVFSYPPAASVKVNNFDKYTDVIYGKFPFAASARAQIEGQRTGFVKAAVEKNSERILAVWIIGTNADELIDTASVIIQNKMSVKDLSKNMFFHPGFSEMILNACEAALGKCTELPNIL